MLRMKNAGLGLGILAGLALLAGCRAASERAGSPASSQDPRLTSTTVPGGAYAVGVPDGWERTWTEAPGWRSPSELRLAAPDTPWPRYVTITVLHYPEAERTPDRYLFDQLRDSARGAGGARPAVEEIVAAGRQAKTFEAAADRRPPLGMTGDTIASRVRLVVVPASRGFFVLRSDVPEGADKTYRAAFDRVVESFTPADKDRPLPQDPIPAREYEVLAALFGVTAPGGPDAPQFFDAVPECRLVAGATMTVEKPREPGWPGKEFGTLEPGQVGDYLAKNEKAWPLTDRIMVPDLAVISPEELDSRLSSGLKNPAGEEESVFGLRGGYVTLSRVGFNGAGDLALLSAAFTQPRAMSARYLVLMKKSGSRWGLAKVAMDDLIYQ